ncbi:MogA/MoaB family molybdenum cofactor biosynthesis protein, partial [Staphylococcus aureus]
MAEHSYAKMNRTVKAVVLTVSETRAFDTDNGGQCVRQLLHADDVEVRDARYTILTDETVALKTQVKQWLEEDIDVIITTGGTALAQRDVTIEAAKPLLTQEIEG